MNNNREVDPADMTWSSTEIADVTGVVFTNTETGETIELEARSGSGHAETDEVIFAWDGHGIWRFGS